MSLPDGSRNNKVVEQEHLFFFLLLEVFFGP